MIIEIVSFASGDGLGLAIRADSEGHVTKVSVRALHCYNLSNCLVNKCPILRGRIRRAVTTTLMTNLLMMTVPCSMPTCSRLARVHV